VKSLGPVLPFILILGAFWLLIIRPARTKQRAAASMQRQLSVGSQVMLTSGLYGEVAAIEDDAVVIETSPGVRMRWAKPAVARILTPKDDVSGDDGRSDRSDSDVGALEAGEPAAGGDPTEPEGTTGTESTEQR
jgi:preprotein translocase subunit YajC